MNIQYGLVTTALAAILCGGPALAEGGFLGADSAYVGVGGGLSLLQDQDLNIPAKPATTGGALTNLVIVTPAVPGASKLNADTGWDVLGTLGLRWENGMRLELEGDYRDNDFKVNGVGGTVTGTSVMINGLYDFSHGKIRPYLGLGVGGLFTDYDAAGVFPGGSHSTGAYQALGGITVPFSDRWEGFADYRYFTSMEKVAPTDDFYTSHEVKVGIRYTFWEAPKPVATPAPAPVAQPKDYVIYFEFDKSNITKAAGAVLDELKATSGGSPVSIVGHTDTMGSAAYNQKLSERRAKNTAKALGDRGVKVDSASGKGFTEPAVNTGPNVKEPLNRRAVIKLHEGMTQ